MSLNACPGSEKGTTIGRTERLTSKGRDVVIQRLSRGRSYAECVQMVGISATTVRKWRPGCDVCPGTFSGIHPRPSAGSNLESLRGNWRLSEFILSASSTEISCHLYALVAGDRHSWRSFRPYRMPLCLSSGPRLLTGSEIDGRGTEKVNSGSCSENISHSDRHDGRILGRGGAVMPSGRSLQNLGPPAKGCAVADQITAYAEVSLALSAPQLPEEYL